MMRRLELLPSALVGGALLCASPAAAQFDAPRPPGSVGRPQPQYQQAPQYPQYQQPQQYQQQPQYAPQYQPYQQQQPQYAPPQTAARPGQSGAQPGIQSEELPAPGAAPNRQDRAGTAGQPPAAVPAAAPAQPQAAPPPSEVVTAPPAQRISNPTAVFSGLDKITGRITSFDAAIGETVQFGSLQVTTRACYSRPPTETPLTDGFVEVDEVTLQGDIRRIFTGWMFAASPGLHGVEHAVYDVWLVDCKGAVQAAADPPPAAAQPRQPSPSRQGAPQQRQPQPPSRQPAATTQPLPAPGFGR